MRLRMRMSTIHCRLHTRMMTTAHRISTKVTQVGIGPDTSIAIMSFPECRPL